LQLPAGLWVIGFGPNGQTALIESGPKTATTGDEPYLTSVDLVKIPSGAVLKTMLSRGWCERSIGSSRDGRIWVFHEGGLDGQRLFRLDLEAMTAVPLAVNLDRYNHTFPTTWPPVDGNHCVAPDGTTCVLHDTVEDGLTIWDLSNDRPRAFAPGIRPPYQISEDSRFVVGVIERNGQSDLAVVNLTTAEIKTFEGLRNEAPIDVRISDDGSHIAAVYATGGQAPDIKFELVTWSVNDSGLRRQMTMQRPKFIGNSALIATLDDSDSGVLSCVDVSDGVQPWSFPAYFGRFFIAPNRATILVENGFPDCGLVEEFLTKFGFRKNSRELIEKTASLYDLSAGRHLCDLPGQTFSYRAFWMPQSLLAHWVPDGTAVAIFDPDSAGTWKLWDIPPRKSLTWFAAGAALLGLPILYLARRRIHRLKAA
jgi:hypothetical protein